MMSDKFEKKAFLLIVCFSFLIFFAQTRSFLLLLDGLTYVSLAKNILSSHHWSSLFYSPEQFSEFYHHPPLAIWMQALMIKFFGSSEPVMRIIPASFCFLSVISVYLFTKKRFGFTAAFYASIVLMTSTRFVKWGSNFYLDGIFSFFCFSGFALWVDALADTKRSIPKKVIKAFFAGILLLLAFMTKGVIAFGVISVCILGSLFFISTLNFSLFFPLLLGALVPLFLWIQLADGATYIQRYLHESVSGRVGGALIWDYLIHPWRNIYKLWWPWCPLFFISIYTSLRFLIQKKPSLFVALAAALGFPIGFSLSPFYLEHYLTPFYPFAAVSVGVQLSLYFPNIKEKGIELGYGLLILSALFLATIAPSVHEEKFTTPVLWVKELQTLSPEKQSQIKQIAFSEKAADIWLSIATVQGKTNWLAIGNFALNRPVLSKTVLILKKDEKPDSKWSLVPCLWVEGFSAYASPDLDLCR